jgi:hypothetical protein
MQSDQGDLPFSPNTGKSLEETMLKFTLSVLKAPPVDSYAIC